MSYNTLLTTLEVNATVKFVIPTIIAKSTLTYTNCGKIGHLEGTCHNKKKKVLVVPTFTIKSIELVAGIKTQLVKSGKITIHYHYIICCSIEHRFKKFPKKIEAHNMFKIKHVKSNATLAPKPPKTNNVLVNVVDDVTIHSQQSKQ